MEKRKRAAVVTAALLMAAIFGFLAHAVASDDTKGFDRAVRDDVHAAASPPFTMAMRGATLLGSSEVLFPLGAFIFWRLLAQRRRRDAVWFLIAALGGGAIDYGLKLFFQRPRPEAYFGLAEPASWSFPSGHSMGSFCFYGAIAAIAAARAHSSARRVLILLATAVIVFVIGFSRVYLGVHYPTDVLGGYTAGLAWLLAIWAAGARNAVRPTPSTPGSPSIREPE